LSDSRRKLNPETAPPGWRPAALALLVIALTSAGHYLTPREFLLWHGIFQRLYYLPVVYAAIAYGLPGGLAAAFAAGLLYIPHIMTAWSHMRHYAMEQYAEIVMFFAVGAVTGVLAGRERRRRNELQQVHRELKETFEQVKRADRLSAVGQLAAGLAHEIRNPLASIDGAAEVLDLAPAEPVRQETLRIIRQECARLNRLLGSLLDFARPRSPEAGEVDVVAVLEGVIELVRHSGGKNVRFRRDSPARLAALRCDREQLSQVVLNLALNAAQAMPQGGEVVLAAFEENSCTVIEVRDQGAGVPPELLDRIFDPFFTTKDTGTGLGLAVVYQIVTRHGGAVEARPNEGAGMTFVVRLPRAKGEVR
jgi:signal transduction histidine kinase